VHIALIMAVVAADYWGSLHRPTIGLRSVAEHTDRWATATRPFAPRSGANAANQQAYAFCDPLHCLCYEIPKQ
jgi:hypothetical protein